MTTMEKTRMTKTSSSKKAPAVAGTVAAPTRTRRRAWWVLAGLAGLLGVMIAPLPSTAAGPAEDGLVCTTNSSASFVLTAKTGYVTTPDMNSMFMWSYSNGNNGFQYPGPNLCVNEGDNVTITLKNTLTQVPGPGLPAVPVPTSIMFPGISGVLADGQPSQPDLVNNSLTKVAVTGGSVTYTFKAADAGTYLYESGTDPQTQVRMGLVGALIVRPAGHPDYVYTPKSGYPSTQFNKTREFLHLLTEVDPDQHQAIEFGKPFDPTQYKPRYYMINGRSFPDTIAPNFSAHLPSQPYGSLVHVVPKSAGNPLPAVVRYLNAGPVNYPFHPHSNHERIIGIDGRQLANPNVVTSKGKSGTIDAVALGATSLVYTAAAGGAPGINDSFTLDALTATQETVIVTACQIGPTPPVPALPTPCAAGTGPYTVALKTATTFAHAAGTAATADTMADTSIDHFGIVVVPGQTQEGLFSWQDAQQWDPATMPVYVQVPQIQNRTEGAFWSGSPYLGVLSAMDLVMQGKAHFNQCGEFYHVAHSHALFQATNYGLMTGTGMLTMIRVDPPDPSKPDQSRSDCLK
jgi:FtsP/CotA-like multicopper oxidase with cupredoxin domain